MHLTFYLRVHLSACESTPPLEDAPHRLSAGTPAFEVEIKGAIEVTIKSLSKGILEPSRLY